MLAAAVMAALAASAAAQAQFADLGKLGLPPGQAGASAVGDVDGDGDLDVVFAATSSQLRLLRNDGAGGFDEAPTIPLPASNGKAASLVLGDVDGDGDLDLVVGNTSNFFGAGPTAQNRLYLNDGSGTFTDATALQMPVDNANTNVVVLGDVDGDGDLDLLVGNEGPYSIYSTTIWGGQNWLYLNNGAGTFVDATAARVPANVDITKSLALGDVDGDGDLDLIVGNAAGAYSSPQNLLYRNNGTGTFTDVTAAQMPVDGDGTFALALGDVDGDGDVDLITGNGANYWSGQQDRLYLNNGAGTFADATAAQMPVDADLTTSLALGDVDGDGDLDLIVGNRGGGYPSLPQNLLYRNNGTGTFADATATQMPIDNDDTISLALGDVDGDGDADLILGGGGGSLYVNNGTGTFTDTSPLRVAFVGYSFSHLCVDVDGDGDLDLVYGRRLYRNNGNGWFTDVTAAQMPSGTFDFRAVASGDVDGDGDVDLVLGAYGSSGQQNRLYLNNGAGTFTDATAARMPVVTDRTTSVALGDVDGDGDLDLLVGNAYQQNRLYRNNGAGTFVDATAAQMPVDADVTHAVATGDVDGDGDLDLVVGNYWSAVPYMGGILYTGQQNRLYLNNGAGAFTDATAARMPVATDRTNALALADVDGDGDLDLVAANLGQNRLCRNDGTGTFTDVTSTRMPIDTGNAKALAVGDVDGDGDLDLVFANGYCGKYGCTGEQDQLYLNDGAGTFVDATAARLPADVAVTRSLALGDVDGDGDLDLFAGDHLYLNLLRQFDVPHVLRIGRDYQLDVYARYGPVHLVDVALPYFAPATAHIPIPGLGLLGIDPFAMTALPPFLVPQPAGVGSLLVPIPDLPGLVGIAIHTQVLLVQYPIQDHLTNVYSGVFLN